ncbi:MAG TPA: dTMP kinase [Clostridiales bacterium UBA8153]|nr:dTMP kinase [Clostridiales bacterium UBA8153]
MSTGDQVEKGRFIVLEGIDGAGITTQAHALAGWLTARGRPVLVTKEPSCGAVGSLLRQALSGQLRLDEAVVAMLFVADRLDHLTREVMPALQAGTDVVSDRYYFSSLAYQSLEVPIRWLAQLNAPCLQPDLTILIDVPAGVALERVTRRGKAREIYERPDTLDRVRCRYLDLARVFARAGHPLHRVDGSPAVAQVAAGIARQVEDLLAQPAGPASFLRDLVLDWEGWP